VGATELARALLEKARHDIIAAELIIVSDEALDTVCFHAQQAAEKALKALLALDDIVFPHTHDLAQLLELVRPAYPELADLADELADMTAFAVDARYDVQVSPDRAEAQRALAVARTVHVLAALAVHSRADL